MDIVKAYNIVRRVRGKNAGDLAYVHATVREGSVRLAGTDGIRLYYADVPGDWGMPGSGILVAPPTPGVALDLWDSEWPNYDVLLTEEPVFARVRAAYLREALLSIDGEHATLDAQPGVGLHVNGELVEAEVTGHRAGAANPRYLADAVAAVRRTPAGVVSLAWTGAFSNPIFVDASPVGPVRALVMPRRVD